jgi:hypothetical protein
LLIYLVGLQNDEADKEKLIDGSRKLKKVAASVYSRHQVDVYARQLVVIMGS